MATSEANVIGALCKNKDIAAVLGEDKEVFGAYGDVFDFIRDHYLKYQQVPDKTLVESNFDEVDIPTDTQGPTKYYVDALKNEYVSNKMFTLSEVAMSNLDGGKPPARVLERFSTELAKLARFTTSAKDVNIMDAEFADNHFAKLREAADANDGTPGIATGFKSIDSAYTTGMGPGHSIVVMGYTGRGKSMWADLLACNVHAQGKKPMIISLEMSPEEQMERIYAIMGKGQFKISELSRGQIAQDDFQEFRRRKLDTAAPFVVVSSQGQSDVTPNFVQAKIDTHRPDVVILDYLQLMNDNGKTQAMTPRMLNLSREIKMLAMSNAIPIVSITAVTDEDNDKRDSPPLLSQVAWSKGIEYDANHVISIHRHDDTNLVECAGRKNRHGPLYNFGFEVDFDAGIWTERFDLF